MSVSLPHGKCIEVRQLVCALLLRPAVMVYQVMALFLAKPPFVPMAMLSFASCASWSGMLIYFLLFSFLFLHGTSISHLTSSRIQCPCYFFFLMFLFSTDAMPPHWVFCFQGSGLPVSSCGTWSGSMWKFNITLQEPSKLLHLILHKMVFRLFDKVVSLHLGNSTNNTYLCNQGGTASFLLSRLACCILTLTSMVLILFPAYIPTHLNMGAISPREGWFQSGICFLTFLSSISSLETSWGGAVGILMYQSMSAVIHLRKSTTSGSLGFECFQPPLDLSGELWVSSSYIGFLVLSRFLSKHVTGEFKLLILVAPCWMEALWLPIVLGLEADIPHWYPIVKDLIMDISVGWELRGLLRQHFTLWLVRDMCSVDKGLLSQSVRQW